MTRNHEPYRNLPGEYSTDLVADAALGFLDDAIGASDRPFFIGIAPIAPHSETITSSPPARFEPPVPAKRHEHLFENVTIPRTPNFNPDTVSIIPAFLGLPAHGCTPAWNSIILQDHPPAQPIGNRIQRQLVPQASPVSTSGRRAHRLCCRSLER
jgi:hypothetical protein